MECLTYGRHTSDTSDIYIYYFHRILYLILPPIIYHRERIEALGIQTMSNQEKQTAPQSPPIPEIVGIGTAIDQISAVAPRLTAAIQAEAKTESELTTFRTQMNAMPTGIQKDFLVAHQSELEAQITDASRKAVSDALKEVQVHMTTIAQLAATIQGKHGKPVQNVKNSDRGTGHGDITSGNMDALRELLLSRGIHVQYELQEDGKHYYAVDLASGRKSKYASNVRSDWV
jgi:hypothetical protein